MALVLLSRQDDYDLVHSRQDCRGLTARDTDGDVLGKVTDMVIDTEAEHVDSIILEGGAQIPAADIALRDGVVLVRAAALNRSGVAPAAMTRQTMATNATTTNTTNHAATNYAAASANAAGEIALPVIEERIMVGKRAVESGGVRVSNRVTERPVEETVTLREEHVHVERRPANRTIDSIAEGALRGGVIEVSEMAEEAVVAKQARVVEEVVIGKETIERQETIRDTVRRTDVETEEIEVNTARRT